MEDATDISKMKVADLKKELKARGLSVTGNKTDLVERLQEAIDCGGNVSIEGGGDVPEEDFDEEEILGEDDIDSELTPQEEEAALGVPIRVKDEAALLEPPEKKKISLKRSQPSLSPPEPTTPKTPVEGEAPPPGEEEEEEKEVEEENKPPAKKVIKLDSAADKSDLKARAQRFGLPLTEEARKEARIARFGTATNGTIASKQPEESNVPKVMAGDAATGITEEAKKEARAARFGLTSSKPTKISLESDNVDMDRLMKRAERFGEVTSPALLKVAEEEKRKTRLERFGEATAEDKGKTAVSGSIDDILAKRKARFGVVAATDEEEKKKKRAERFAI